MSNATSSPTSVSPSDSAKPARLRVAIVGCGAVTKANLLPVLAGHDGLTIAALVDRDLARAQDLARAYAVPRAVTDMEAILNDVDAVVLATPPSHHAPATIALAARGKHVLVEKPMATNAADAEAMVEAAERNSVALSVGLYRRMLPSVRLMRALVESGDYGRPLAIDAEEGGPYGWQLATLAVLTQAGGGGGVLIDIGSHVIDAVLFMVPGEPTLTDYQDNVRGGIETDCVAHFTITLGRSAIPVRLELSRTRELRGSIRIQCERAMLELHRANFTQVIVHPSSGVQGEAPAPSIRIAAEWAGDKPFVGYQAFREEIDDWVTAITRRTQPILSGRSVLPVVRLIENCYRRRTPLVEPWTDEGFTNAATQVQVSSPRRRVLVTGAGGFLGGRAVELLRERHGWDAIPLVHEPKSAARLARWPQDIRLGNVCSAADMDRAVAGCEAVVHCAVGTIWPPDAARRVTVEGTRTVAEAALRGGVKRLVHISTLFVHRRDGAGLLNEQTAVDPPADDDYGQAKLAAEQALAEVAKKGLSTIVLRPVRIYGPFSKTFTIRPLQAMKDGIFGLKGDPDVPANMVYVDNVVEAIARALDAESTLSGSAYLVSDADQLTLREFYEFFAKAGGLRVKISTEASNGAAPPAPGIVGQWVSGVKTIVTSPQLRAFIRRVIDTDPVGTLPRKLWDMSPSFQESMLRRFGADAAVIYRPTAENGQDDVLYYGEAARVSIEKAQRELKFTPAVSQHKAMALTIDWARYARLLPGPVTR